MRYLAFFTHYEYSYRVRLQRERANGWMNAEKPRISAIIPVYNGRKYILDAIQSVIAQTLPPLELIIVDDGSTDGSGAVISEEIRHGRIKAPFLIKILRQNNSGQSAARNYGVKECVGDFIALCDQDDIWFPEHLEKLVRPFLRPGNSRLGWVYSNWAETDENGGYIREGYLDGHPLQHPKRDLGHVLGAGMIIQPGAALIKRGAFEAVGGFDQNLSGYEDDDLFTRMMYAGWTNAYIAESLSTWRIYWSSSQFKPRTRESRRYYAKKLMQIFPNDPGGMRMWVRDAIAPRFYHIAIEEYGRAIHAGQWNLARELALDAISYASFTDTHHIRRKDRLKLRLKLRPKLFKWLKDVKHATPNPFRRFIP